LPLKCEIAMEGFGITYESKINFTKNS